jgi:flavin reductase (DIM6/NTAB) family NADH-FMN oxidoreductase RutF
MRLRLDRVRRGIEPSHPVSLDAYRELMSAFPTGVTVVTSIDIDGEPRGMTCSSLTSVTLCPPTLLVCLRTGSATWNAVCSAGGFAVNLLHGRAHRVAELFAGPVRDRFGEVEWRPSPAGYPWLSADAFALADCKVAGTMMVGDHTVIVGEVGEVLQIGDQPLLYGLRRFLAWPQ